MLIILYYVIVLIDTGKYGVCHADIILFPFRDVDYSHEASGRVKEDIHQGDVGIEISRRHIIAFTNESYSWVSDWFNRVSACTDMCENVGGCWS